RVTGHGRDLAERKLFHVDVFQVVDVDGVGTEFRVADFGDGSNLQRRVDELRGVAHYARVADDDRPAELAHARASQRFDNNLRPDPRGIAHADAEDRF